MNSSDFLLFLATVLLLINGLLAQGSNCKIQTETGEDCVFPFDDDGVTYTRSCVKGWWYWWCKNAAGDTITCNGDITDCTPYTVCSDLPAVDNENAVVTCTHGYELESSCEINCNTGYQLVSGTTSKVTCTMDLTTNRAVWSTTNMPTCQEIKNCGYLIAIENGQPWECTDGSFLNSCCTASCMDGYKLIGEEVMCCRGNPETMWWDNASPTCAEEDIGMDKCNLGLDNCAVNALCENTDGSFTCTCNDGYSGDGVLCTEMTCPVAPAIHNGELSCSSGNDVSSLCQIICNKGYELLYDSNLIVCNDDGFWSVNDWPECYEIKQCSRLDPIENGYPWECTDDNNLRSQCTASCMDGYTLVGEAILDCLANTEKEFWNYQQPKCKREELPTTNDPPTSSFDLSIDSSIDSDSVKASSVTAIASTTILAAENEISSLDQIETDYVFYESDSEAFDAVTEKYESEIVEPVTAEVIPKVVTEIVIGKYDDSVVVTNAHALPADDSKVIEVHEDSNDRGDGNNDKNYSFTTEDEMQPEITTRVDDSNTPPIVATAADYASTHSDENDENDIDPRDSSENTAESDSNDSNLSSPSDASTSNNNEEKETPKKPERVDRVEQTSSDQSTTVKKGNKELIIWVLIFVASAVLIASVVIVAWLKWKKAGQRTSRSYVPGDITPPSDVKLGEYPPAGSANELHTVNVEKVRNNGS